MCTELLVRLLMVLLELLQLLELFNILERFGLLTARTGIAVRLQVGPYRRWTAAYENPGPKAAPVAPTRVTTRTSTPAQAAQGFRVTTPQCHHAHQHTCPAEGFTVLQIKRRGVLQSRVAWRCDVFRAVRVVDIPRVRCLW